jgi:hypothetical protein
MFSGPSTGELDNWKTRKKSGKGGNVHACETLSDWSTGSVHVIFSCDVTEPEGRAKTKLFFRVLSVCQFVSRLRDVLVVCVSKCVSVLVVKIENLQKSGRHFFVCDTQNHRDKTHTADIIPPNLY